MHADSRGHIARLLALAINQNSLDMALSAADKSNVLAMLRQFGDLDGSFEEKPGWNWQIETQDLSTDGADFIECTIIITFDDSDDDEEEFAEELDFEED